MTVLALLGVIGLLVFVPASRSTPRPPEPKREVDQLGGQRQATRPAHEGSETSDWDELRSSERVDRAERVIAAALAEGADVDARARARMMLSAARADWFTTAAGRRRYLDLEQALLDADEVATE